MKVNTDRVLSLSAMVVGVGSLAVILYQTHLMRQSQHAAVLPYLMIAVNSNEHGVFLNLRNAGIGPAVIDRVHVLHQDREHPGDAYDFVLSVRSEQATQSLSVDKILDGRLIAAGETIQMMGVPGVEGQSWLRELLGLFEVAEVPRLWLRNMNLPESGANRAVLVIDYSSVFGDRWRVRSDRIRQEPR